MEIKAYLYPSKEEALAAQSQLNQEHDMPKPGGDTLNIAGIHEVEAGWVLDHCDEAEQLFGEPAVVSLSES